MTFVRQRPKSSFRTAAVASLIAISSLLAATSPAFAFKACPLVRSAEAPPTPPPVKGSTEPANVGLLKLKAMDYKCFGDYDRDVAALFRVAQEYVEGHLDGVAKPAIVFDIDETTLSNWPAILDDDFGYIADGSCDLGIKGGCGWDDWQESALDQVISPALQLYNSAKARGIAIFFITGRRDEGTMRAATEANLRAAGYIGWKDVIMRPKDSPHLDTIIDFKAPARANIEAQGYTIIANIGDQMSDLGGGHAQMIFKVPNPFYFIP